MSNADKIVNHTFLKVYLRKKFILDFFCDFKLQSIGHKSLENFFVLHIQTDKSDSSLTKCCCVNGFLSHTFWCSWPIQNWNCSQLRMSNMVLASSLRKCCYNILETESKTSEQLSYLGLTERYFSKTSSSSFFLFARFATISFTCAMIVPKSTAALIKRNMQYT